MSLCPEPNNLFSILCVPPRAKRSLWTLIYMCLEDTYLMIRPIPSNQERQSLCFQPGSVKVLFFVVLLDFGEAM